MKTFYHHFYVKFAFSLLLILFYLFSISTDASALSPGDLIIVCNLNMKQSRGVAGYYAKKRGVPASNIVGVDVSTSERMFRSEFEKKLMPPVRKMIKRLKEEGKNPAILLVYGIPLIVKDLKRPKYTVSFVPFVKDKIKEYKKLALEMTAELDRLTGQTGPIPVPPKRQTNRSATKDVIELVGKSFNRGLEHLEKSQTSNDPNETHTRISSLLIRLAGISPAVKNLAARLSMEDKAGTGMPKNQPLLRWDAILRKELVERLFWGTLPKKALETAATVRFIDGIIGELRFWDTLKTVYEKGRKSASVDSELTLMMVGSFPHASWLPNPFHIRYD